MPNDSLNHPVDFDSMSPHAQAVIASYIKYAALDLIESLPDEPEFKTKESPMKKLLATIARQFQAQPCPLEGIQPLQSQIKSAYENRLGSRQTGILSGYRSRSEALFAHTWSPRSIR